MEIFLRKIHNAGSIIIFLATVIVQEVTHILRYLLATDEEVVASKEAEFENIGEALEFSLFKGHLEYIPERKVFEHHFLGFIQALILITTEKMVLSIFS
jgi:hypothetical protein